MEHHTAIALDYGQTCRITHPVCATKVTLWMEKDIRQQRNTDVKQATGDKATRMIWINVGGASGAWRVLEATFKHFRENI